MASHLRDIYHNQLGLSIEIFPPKTPKGDESLRRTLGRLALYQPAFFSCTYGAGGSTSKRTIDWCREIQTDFDRSATAHFTCVGSTRDELISWLGEAEQAGIRNIMALRGDPPQGQDHFEPVAGGLRYANELVTLIKEHFPDMGIGVAGYPEKHQECPDPQTDLENLKRKTDCGADAVFTQLFYENTNFLVFRERYHAAGISLPLVPGIMPITEFARIQRITAMCGAVFPDDLSSRLEAVSDDAEAQFEIGVEHAIRQCEELLRHDVPGIHFYVLNKPQACERIIDALGMKPETLSEAG